MNRLKNVFVLLVIVTSLCLEQIVIACGGDSDYYDDYATFFHNNTTGSAAYMPFYLIAYCEYYGDWDWTGLSKTEPEDLNISEWIAFSQDKINKDDATSFIYKYSYPQLSNLYYHIEKGNALQLPDSVMKNGMTKWFLQDKDLEALGYLMFAKKNEANTVAGSDWEVPQRDAGAMAGNIKGGLQLWKAAKKDFFKWRYAYQVLRLAFYSGDYDRTTALYKELVGDKTVDNIMYYRCLSLKAGAAYKTNDYNTAAYLYSIAFNGTDDNKFSNYVSYNWCFRNHGEQENGPRASRKDVLAKCTTSNQKAVISVMDALHQYDEALPLLKEAYNLDPKVKGLSVAMTREVNKMETKVLDPLLNSKNGFRNYDYPYIYANTYRYREPESEELRKERLKNKEDLDKLLAFSIKVSDEDKTGETAYWTLSTAYLYFIKQDWKNCETWLAKAEKLNPQGKVKDMLMIEQLLLTINKNQKLDASTEQKILPSLQWLEQRAIKDPRFTMTYRNLMTTVLPNVYLQQQDTMKALLCIAKGSTGPDGTGIGYWYYAEKTGSRAYVNPGYSVELEQVTTARIIALKDWIKAAKKTPYESFLVKYEPYETGALEMYIASRYIRQQDFAKAVEFLKNVPKGELAKYSFQDPFADRWIDTQEPRDTVLVSDRLKFAGDMLRLQQNLTKASAEELYRYANGLYSMTYYGLSWKADMYSRSGSDGLGYYADTTREHLLPEYRNYYSAEEALKYYQLAFNKSKDKELSAKCLFMLSKCWQKNADIPKEYVYDPAQNDPYYVYTLKSPYFLQLNKDFNQTKTFQKLFEECSYLKLYVRRMK